MSTPQSLNILIIFITYCYPQLIFDLFCDLLVKNNAKPRVGAESREAYSKEENNHQQPVKECVMIENPKMNVFQKNALLSLFTVSLACGAQTVIASSSAQATIDWSSFNVQIIDLSGGLNTPVFNWTSENGSNSSHSWTNDSYDNQSDFDNAPDFSSLLSTNTVTSEAKSSSLRSASALQANAATQSGTYDNYAGNNNAYADVSNYGAFGLTGNGLALITASWNLSVTGAKNDWQDNSFALASIIGRFSDGNYNSGSSNSSYSVYSANNGGTFNQNGLFSMAVFSDGIHAVTGRINAKTSASAVSTVSQVPVPVPAAVWLFGSGLGILTLTRRKNQNIRL